MAPIRALDAVSTEAQVTRSTEYLRAKGDFGDRDSAFAFASVS
jgi:hypothetical protein